MALKAQLDSLDGLPEAVAKEYKEVKDGDKVRYVLDAEGVEDVSGLKSALSKERKARTEAEKLMKKLGLKADEESLTAFMEKLGDQTLEEALDAATKAAATADEGTKAVKAAKKLQTELEQKTKEVEVISAFVDTLVRE